MSNFTFGLRIRNIGPLKDVNFNDNFDTNKTVIYAKNGSGKSFFSRTLQKIEKNDISISNSLISLGARQADLKIDIGSGEIEPIKSFEIRLNKDANSNIVLSDNSYILHVFNSSYVKDNIEKRSYGLGEESLRSGYILGKSNIDLSREKKELQRHREEYITQKQALEDSIKSNLDFYKGKFKLGKFDSFRKLQQKSLDNIKIVSYPKIDEELVSLSSQLEKLDNFSDDIPDVEHLQEFQNIINEDEIQAKIANFVPKIKLKDSLEKYISENRLFIEKGINIQNAERCPFCHQPLASNAIEIIQSYHNFLNSQENNMIDFCEKEQNNCKATITNLEHLKRDYDLIKANYNHLKSNLVNFDEILPDLVLPDKAITLISNIFSQLKDKIDNTEDKLDISLLTAEYKKVIQELNSNILEINKFIANINARKNKISEQKRKLKEDIILKVEKKLFNSAKVEDLLKKKNSIFELEKSIQEKENTIRKSKNTEILSTLKYFLNFFFQGKYSVSDDFVITFLERDITSELDHILSDGEKSIVAFCHYLSETHILVQEDSDYKKLFFIIDDPISSLDSDYIYDMVQVIRNIKSHFPELEHEKYIILSHNVEFVSILKRNKIAKNFLELKDGNILRISNDRFNIPYMTHLSDIYNIYIGKKELSHTTANSMRQVLEGIRTFLCPSQRLDKFILNNSSFKDTSLYSYVQDQSHGNIFFDQIINEKEIKQLISDIINYIKNSSFCAQLDDLDNFDG